MQQGDSERFVSGCGVVSDWRTHLLSTLNSPQASMTSSEEGPQGSQRDPNQGAIGLNGPIGAGHSDQNVEQQGPHGSDSRPDQGNIGPMQDHPSRNGKFSFLFGPGGTLKVDTVGNTKEPGVFDNGVREYWLRIIAGKRAGLNMKCIPVNDNPTGGAPEGMTPDEHAQWQALSQLELWAVRPSKN